MARIVTNLRGKFRWDLGKTNFEREDARETRNSIWNKLNFKLEFLLRVCVQVSPRTLHFVTHLGQRIWFKPEQDRGSRDCHDEQWTSWFNYSGLQDSTRIHLSNSLTTRGFNSKWWIERVICPSSFSRVRNRHESLASDSMVLDLSQAGP